VETVSRQARAQATGGAPGDERDAHPGPNSTLGSLASIAYGPGVIGFLRFLGIANAAVWLGGTVFYTVAAGPAMVSSDMQGLLGPKYFPYFSGAVAQILLARYFHFHLACATVAVLHVLAEWMYLGRSAHRRWLGLLVALFGLSLLGSVWLGPRLAHLHRDRHRLNATPQQRQAAARSFRLWHGMFQAVNVLMLGGVAVCLWRVTNPPDELRFVGSTQFRG
jgi:hypothetical protein